MTAQSDLEEIDKLLASRGWTLVEAALKDDIFRAAIAMSKPPAMTTEELHHRRGAIHACSALINVPHVLRAQLEAQVSLSQAPLRPGTRSTP